MEKMAFKIVWLKPSGETEEIEYRASAEQVDSARLSLIDCGRAHGLEPIECPPAY
jgi:hypothetical protein